MQRESFFAQLMNVLIKEPCTEQREKKLSLEVFFEGKHQGKNENNIELERQKLM